MRRIAVFLVVGLVAGACGGGEVAGESRTSTSVVTPSTTAVESVTTTEPSTTTTTTEATTTTTWDSTEWLTEDGPAALVVIDEFYVAMNSGDPAAWAMVGSPFVRPDLDMLVDGVGGEFAHQCSLSENARRVSCVESVRDGLYTPAGASLEVRAQYEVRDDGRLLRKGISCTADDPSGDSLAYLLDLYDWTVATYPDLEVLWTGNLEFGLPGIPCTPYPFRDVEAARQIVALVPEFLAQSTRWPVEIERIGDIELRRFDDGTIVGVRVSDLYRQFTLTRCPGGCSVWSEGILAREPGGTLSTLGYQGGAWTVAGSVQAELSRLWPPEEATKDVVWLTDYSGTTRDILTGYEPEPSDSFTLFDEIILSCANHRYGMHVDCMSDGIFAALVNLGTDTPSLLMAWTVDVDTMTLVEADDLASIILGECGDPSARP